MEAHSDQATTSQPGVILEVPVIDIGIGSESANTVRQISDASSEWGMFQIVNHGIPDDVITKMHGYAKEYFELVQKEMKMMAAAVPGCNKYSKNKGWVDYFSTTIWPPCPHRDRYYLKFDTDPPRFREIYEDYAKRHNRVTDKVLKCLSLGLGLEENAMKNAIGSDDQLTELSMGIGYYKPCPRPNHFVGIEKYWNRSTLTILVPVQGLQLQVLRNESWYDVKYIPNALIAQIGKGFEILSNGRYKSVVHKTIANKYEARMLWSVGLHPSIHRKIGPFSELVNEESPAKFKTGKYCMLIKTF